MSQLAVSEPGKVPRQGQPFCLRVPSRFVSHIFKKRQLFFLFILNQRLNGKMFCGGFVMCFQVSAVKCARLTSTNVPARPV